MAIEKRGCPEYPIYFHDITITWYSTGRIGTRISARWTSRAPGRFRRQDASPPARAGCQATEDSGSGVAGYDRLGWTGPCVLAAGALFRPHPSPSLPALAGFRPVFLCDVIVLASRQDVYPPTVSRVRVRSPRRISMPEFRQNFVTKEWVIIAVGTGQAAGPDACRTRPARRRSRPSARTARSARATRTGRRQPILRLWRGRPVGACGSSRTSSPRCDPTNRPRAEQHGPFLHAGGFGIAEVVIEIAAP